MVHVTHHGDDGRTRLEIFLVVLLVVLRVLLSVIPLLAPEEFLERLVVDGIGEVLRHALETSEAALRILRLVAHIHASVLVEGIGIGGKDGIQRESVALGELQADAHVQVAPGLGLGRHVVAHAGTQFIDKAYLAVARAVLVRPHLHLHVVAQVHVDASCLALGCRAVGTAAVGRIHHGGDIAVGIGLHVGVPETEAGLAEVGSIAESHGGCDDVTDGLYLLAAKPRQGGVEGVQLGVGVQREAVVVHVVEAVERVALQGIGLGVPGLHHLVGVGAVGKRETGRHVDIVEDGEGGVDGHLVAHAVLPVLNQAAFQKQAFFGVDAVGERARVAHGYLFVPSLLARHFLAFQGVELVERDVERRQGEGDGAVAHVLA